jgi:hypothetical protein
MVEEIDNKCWWRDHPCWLKDKSQHPCHSCCMVFIAAHIKEAIPEIDPKEIDYFIYEGFREALGDAVVDRWERNCGTPAITPVEYSDFDRLCEQFELARDRYLYLKNLS